MLASGAGLVALAVLNLWRAVQDADARAQLDAQRNAQSMAQALQAVLRAPEFAGAVAAEQRFSVADGALVIPDELAWLQPPPRWQEPLPLSIEVEDRLQRAEAREFGEGDGLGALADLVDLLGSERLEGQARDRVALRAAWTAHRAGDAPRRDELLDGLAELDGQRAVSAALLHAARSGTVPPALWQALLDMPVAEVDSVSVRLAQHGVDVEELVVGVRRRARWRESLRAVRSAGVLAAARLPGLHGPRVSEGRLVALHASADGEGRGYSLTADQLVEVLSQPMPVGVPEVASVGELVVADGDAFAADVVPVVSGWLGVRPVAPEPSLWSRPLVLGGVVGGLALLFGAGLYFALRAAGREAAAMRARADFLTVVTHELKTPLASIRLLSEMLEEGRVAGDRVREYYGLLWSESARLTMLIENVLDLGRMERGERSYDLRGQSVEEVVGEAVELMRPLMEKEGVVLVYEPWDPPVWSDLDRGAMLQALLNVLDNARKYGAEGRRVEVATRPGAGSAARPLHEVLVRDHGPGVAPLEREGIFVRFKRGQAQMDGSVPGVGLGLYLARSILRRHDGDLRCEEPEDGAGGVCFVFELPVGEQPVLRQAFRPPAAADGGT